jgi:hypothetical protein
VNVHELVDLLAKQIADGRGGDEVFVSLIDDTMDDRTLNILGRCNWTVTELDLNDGRSNFVGLYAQPDN